METMKLPRKLKKQVKKVVLKGKDSEWKSSEVKIISFEQLSFARTEGYRRMGTPYLNGKLVTAYRLTPR